MESSHNQISQTDCILSFLNWPLSMFTENSDNHSPAPYFEHESNVLKQTCILTIWFLLNLIVIYTLNAVASASSMICVVISLGLAYVLLKYLEHLENQIKHWRNQTMIQHGLYQEYYEKRNDIRNQLETVKKEFSQYKKKHGQKEIGRQ